MIDPVSAIGLATAAYRGIKSAIDTGKELHDMAGTLSQWAGAMSDLDFSPKQAQNQPMFKKLFGASQIKQNGRAAWDEIVRMEGEMRKKRAAEVYAKEERKQVIVEWIVGLTAAIIGTGLLAFIVYIIGKLNGSW